MKTPKNTLFTAALSLLGVAFFASAASAGTVEYSPVTFKLTVSVTQETTYPDMADLRKDDAPATLKISVKKKNTAGEPILWKETQATKVTTYKLGNPDILAALVAEGVIPEVEGWNIVLVYSTLYAMKKTDAAHYQFVNLDAVMPYSLQAGTRKSNQAFVRSGNFTQMQYDSTESGSKSNQYKTHFDITTTFGLKLNGLETYSDKTVVKQVKGAQVETYSYSGTLTSIVGSYDIDLVLGKATYGKSVSLDTANCTGL